MSDLISRQDAINLLKKWSDGYEYIETETELAIKEFQRLPSAEVKRGRWIEDGHYERCSECGEVVDELYNYCPCCGAKMESEQ